MIYLGLPAYNVVQKTMKGFLRYCDKVTKLSNMATQLCTEARNGY